MVPLLSQHQSDQPHLVAQLRHNLCTRHLPPAVILIGATTAPSEPLAQAWTASLLCTEPTADGDACQRCVSCQLHGAHPHPDHLILGGEGSSSEPIGIGAWRQKRQHFGMRQLQAPQRVLHIQAAERLTREAQNALLKDLEEPAGANLFVLTTQRPAALLSTLRSRCQHLRLRSLPHPPLWPAWQALGLELDLARLITCWRGPAEGDPEAEQAALAVQTVWRTVRQLGKQTRLSPAACVEAASHLAAEPRLTATTQALLEVVLTFCLAAPPWLDGALRLADRRSFGGCAAAVAPTSGPRP